MSMDEEAKDTLKSWDDNQEEQDMNEYETPKSRWFS